MPLLDVVVRTGTLPPVQIFKDVPKLNTGMVFGLMVTVNVNVVAHCPADGVNVYTPEFWLSTVDGLQVPVIPLVDVPGNDGTDEPAQYDWAFPKENVGVITGLMVTVNVVDRAHCPAEGVNVYTPEFILSTVDGLQVPVIPLVEVPGKAGTVAPAQ